MSKKSDKEKKELEELLKNLNETESYPRKKRKSIF